MYNQQNINIYVFNPVTFLILESEISICHIKQYIYKEILIMDQNEPKAPHDEKKKDTIENLALHVAKHGKEFEKKFKERRGKSLHFLEEGKEFNDYYKHRVYFTLNIILLDFSY